MDVDKLIRERKYLAPKTKEELTKKQIVQEQAFANLSNYLTADYMDLYIATSMRTDEDFISVNTFVEMLLNSEEIKKLQLRYFNPTQSWIEDRVAKGLVEALMLKRAAVTIYMAQKSDTFGKDSEASVSLGQGKAVIVYVPKLKVEEVELDSEELYKRDNRYLSSLLGNEPDDICDRNGNDCDKQALVGAVLNQYFDKMSDELLIQIIKKYLSEFDLVSEDDRIKNLDIKKETLEKKEFREFLEKVKKSEDVTRLSMSLRSNLINIFIAMTIRYEQRAELFKETHPLALQIIMDSGVLNGIIVVRSVQSCADVLYGLLENSLKLCLKEDESNYKLIEESTGSTIRVISKNILLNYSFEQFYKYKE
ncbi:MAG: hypothetical protein ACJAWW_002621 [Sulfurimonas sp.]